MQYYVTTNNIHIYDSYIYSKDGFRSRLELIREKYPDCQVFNHRSLWHMEMEWAVHNFAFKMGWKVNETGSVDLNVHQAWYIKTMYAILGPIAWLFIE